MTGIVIKVDEGRFVSEFDRMGRAENFSLEARRALFDQLESLSSDMGAPIQLDVVAICCEWTEYDSAEDAADQYEFPAVVTDAGITPEQTAAALEWLQDRTTVLVLVGGGVVLEVF